MAAFIKLQASIQAHLDEQQSAMSLQASFAAVVVIGGGGWGGGGTA